MTKKSFLLVAVALIAAAGLAYTASHKDSGPVVALDRIEWAKVEGTPLSTAVLSGDPSTGVHILFLKLPAGFVIPGHSHTGDYHGVNLTGTWKHTFVETGEVRELPPGSYVFQPGGEMHAYECIGEKDCVLMIHHPAPTDQDTQRCPVFGKVRCPLFGALPVSAVQQSV